MFVTRMTACAAAAAPLPDARTDRPRAIIIALHGMNDYSNSFDKPGQLWAKDKRITTLRL